MDYRRGRGSRWAALALTVGLITATPAWAGGSGPWAGTGPLRFIAAPIMGLIAVPVIVYAMWLNRPSQQDKAEKTIPGEFYVSAFGGGSLVQSARWEFRGDIFPSTTVATSPVKYQPGVVGGLKFGYFCNFFPWVGVEAETNFTRNSFRTQQVSLSRPVNGTTTGTLPTMRGLYEWTLALHFVGRYGFLKDQEVPFGRLQPYIGIGPGLQVLYTDVDSSKEFSIEAEVGLRYMMLKNLSAFVEYKYSKVFDTLMEDQVLIAGGQRIQKNVNFDVDSHKIVAGVAYHF